MAESRQTDKFAVIMHADVAGSTLLVQRDERLAHERIRDAFRRLGSFVGEHRGSVLELRGDAMLAEFERPSDAVSAALGFQSAHREFLDGLDDDFKPRIRVGIAMGEVIVADNTATGAGVVLAQRVEQLAAGGGICITAAVHEALPRRMPIDYENLGEQALKGFADPVRVFRVSLSSAESISALQPKARTDNSQRSWIRFLGIALSLLAIVGGIAYSWQLNQRNEETSSVNPAAPLPAEKPTIAVLPFVNISGDPEQDYFSDGMTEDLLTDLSRVSALNVISRTSSFAYKGQTPDVRDIGKALGASHVIEGSVRKADNRVRITAQLIDAATGKHLWAERYDREFDEIFELQDEVRARIVSALQVELAAGESTAAMHGTQNAAAYDLVMRGRFHESTFTPAGTAEAIGLYRKAVELDPGYAIAYARMANMHDQQSRFDTSTDRDGDVARALELAQKAIALDESNPFAHWSLGRILARIKQGGIKNQFSAVASLERAIELDPNYADAYAFISYLYAGIGDPETGLDAIEKAMQLNPRYPFWYIRNRGIIYYLLGDYDKAIRDLEVATQKNPTSFIPRWWLAAAYAQSGDTGEAEWQIEELKELGHELTISKILDDSLIFHPPFVEKLADGLKQAGFRE